MNFRNISAAILIALMVVYFLFGDSSNHYWNALYFCTWNYVSVFLCTLVINKYRDKLLNVLLKIIMGTSIFKLLFSIYSIFDIYSYKRLNDSLHVSGIIVVCILTFLIYRRNGLVKK